MIWHIGRMTQEICRFCWDPNRDQNQKNEVCQTPLRSELPGWWKFIIRGNRINVEPVEILRILEPKNMDDCPIRKKILAKMEKRLEAVFVREGDMIGRQLHCWVDNNNRLSWQEMPDGEQGISVPFRDPLQAESFMVSNARILGYPTRLISVQGSFKGAA